MGHEDEEEDDDSNHTNNNDDDNGQGDDHIPQQKQTITHDHPRTRGGKGRRTRRQQPPTKVKYKFPRL